MHLNAAWVQGRDGSNNLEDGEVHLKGLFPSPVLNIQSDLLSTLFYFWYFYSKEQQKSEIIISIITIVHLMLGIPTDTNILPAYLNLWSVCSNSQHGGWVKGSNCK